MKAIRRATSSCVRAIALLEATFAVSLFAAGLTVPTGGLTVTRSGNDLILSFPTTSPDVYAVQTCPDLQKWTDFQSQIPGDGTVKTVTISNEITSRNGFYRLLVQKAAGLLLPQSIAFDILGHWCGGIREKAYVTGFDLTNGYPTGDVFLTTSCSTGGRGSRPATFTAWASVTWDMAGNVISWARLTNTPAVNATFTASDVYDDTIYNVGAAAYLAVRPPFAPTGVTAVQSGDQFQVTWTLQEVNPVAVTSSTLTATPVSSSARVLTTTVVGSATTAIIPSLQPQTTYQITVVNTTIGGSSPPSIPASVTTSPASIPPSVPGEVTASWINIDPTGPTDTLVATWQAAIPGDSPIDQYRITIIGSDGAGTATQTVSGATLTASFTVDYIPNWSVTVQAHNAIGWGPSSGPFMLGGL